MLVNGRQWYARVVCVNAIISYSMNTLHYIKFSVIDQVIFLILKFIQNANSCIVVPSICITSYMHSIHCPHHALYGVRVARIVPYEFSFIFLLLLVLKVCRAGIYYHLLAHSFHWQDSNVAHLVMPCHIKWAYTFCRRNFSH